MALAPASRFGPYEIVGPLGAGGMGEVYRAHDPRLKRDVALKILRPTHAAHPRHATRLLEEARAASALNHPNIVVVFDVGTDGDVPFIVSELVDGVPLRQMLATGPLPIRQLLDIAVQIADGLTAAHEAGLVHRDLKPENVIVRADGQVKILDFGVAKSETARNGADPGTAVPTDTAAGLISGTAPYMSPEQARGREVDFRSDQFSLGLVLYEMAAGMRAFSRDTPVQTLSAIIEDEPVPLTKSKAPLLFEWIIDRCLAKDPRQRYAATADLARDLRMLRDHLAEANGAATTAIPAPRLRVRRWRLLGAWVAVQAAIIAGVVLVVRPGPTATPTYTPFATDAGYQGAPAWSPDGKMIAYAAEVDGVVQIFVRPLDSPQRVRLTRAKFDCRDPFWSPDSSRVYYISLYGEQEGLYSVSVVGGGASEPVMPNVTAADLSPDGTRLAMLRQESEGGRAALRLWFASVPGGEPQLYAAGDFKDRRFADGVLRFAPDGRLGMWAQNWMSFYGRAPVHGLWIVPPAGSDIRIAPSTIGELPNFPPQFDWLDNERVVAALERRPTQRLHLWILNVDTGSATPLTAGAGRENSPTVSPGGTRIAYATQDANFDLFEVPIDGSPARPLLATTRNEMEPAWSPAGDRYAFVTDQTGYPELWLRSQDGTWSQPLVSADAFPDGQTRLLRAPVFSPDGQRIAFERAGLGRSEIWIALVTGGSPVRVEVPIGGNVNTPTWSPTGEWIAFALGTPEGWSLRKLRVGSGAGPELLHGNIVPFTHPKWSPNDRWIACDTAAGLTLVATDGKSSKVVDEERWAVYEWSRDGSTLYGVKQDADDLHRFMLVAADSQSGHVRVINPGLVRVPTVDSPLKGFSRMSAGSFATSLVPQVRSELWLIDDFRPRPGLLERLGLDRAR